MRVLSVISLLATLLVASVSGQSGPATNYAASFPSTSSSAPVTNASNIAIPPLNWPSLPFTVEAWIYPVPGYNDYGSIFFSRSNSPCGLFLRSTQSVANELRSNWQDQLSTTSTGLSVPLNQWSHVALVVTQNSRVVHLNDRNYSYVGNINQANIPMSGTSYMGIDPALPARTFKGLIDELRIWNVAKTLADLQQTRFTSLNGDEPGLYAYYNFNDMNPAAATDSSSRASHGVLNGVTYAPSTVFFPQSISVATAQSAADAASIFQYVAPGTVRNPLARVAVQVVNVAPPALTVTSITFDLQNSSLSAVTQLNVYFTGNAWEFNNNTLFAAHTVAAGSQTVTLTGSITLPAGTSYFWVTGNVASTAAVGSQISVVIQSIGSPNNVFPVSSTTVVPVTVLESKLFSKLTNSHVSIATSNAATPNGGANFVAFQQNAITTFRGWQYMSYWNAQFHVVISRRQLPVEEYGVFGEWQEVEFMDYTITASRVADNHYSISIGICENDGTIHISWDMHGDPLRYRISVPGLATSPETADWATDSFGPRVNDLYFGASNAPSFILSQVTYPRFVQMPDGNLMLEHRYGTSGAGNNYLWKYISATPATGPANWTLIGQYANGLALNPTQNAYVFGVHFRGQRLHVGWCWRLTPDALTNHDMYYAYSDDLGLTWKNAQGVEVGQIDTNPLSLNTPGLKVWTIGTNRALINQESQVVDSKGGIHMLVTYLADNAPNSNNFWGGRTATIVPGTGALLHHLYQLANGSWVSDIVGPATVNRAQIAIDAQDNVYIVAPNWRVFFAASSNGWQTWTSVDYSQSTQVQNEGLIDREMLLNHNMLSFVFSNANNQVVVPTYAKELPKLPANTCCYTLNSPSSPSIWLPYPSGDVTLNPNNPIVPVVSGQGCNGQLLEYWDFDSQTWRANYTDSNGRQQNGINNVYATGTSIKVRTIQTTQSSLYTLLNNKLARLQMTCNNGKSSCMWIQFGSVPGMTQNIERPSTCPF